ncbi:DUF441 domain-containing protein [Clostridium oryzae]|uniref:UPF0756 membrane protein CLORY_15380 n=1 Tax=Clostridium oryzae TaxID=1450648 RepID=A0A1V4ISY2_9CLOT|nr:DUF441 domain-containing protein [Clostridium oryzae]OPJ62914.1 hypothetical protein CLORY_15380 [Clostridium oryzae]
MEANLILILLLAASVIGRANSVSIAIALLLTIRLLNIGNLVFPLLQKHGMFIGLVCLTAAILIPIANGSVSSLNIRNNIFSVVGLLALLLSFFTTYLSGVGLKYLAIEGHSNVMPALILGAVIAAAFLDGVPVGPLITSGMLALIMKLVHKS